jgi:hypothetical protein
MKLSKNMNINRLVITAAFATVVLSLWGCYRDKSDQLYPNTLTGNTSCDTSGVTYSETIKTIIAQNCAISGCHDGSNASTYDMRTYQGLYTYCVATNKLLGSVRHAQGYVAMPQGAPKLDDCTINKITAWVNNGALNN